MTLVACTTPTAGRLQAGGQVSTSTFSPDGMLPLVVQPVDKALDLRQWLADRREDVEAALAAHGGILFRGWSIAGPAEFERAAQSIYGQLYGDYGDLPRADAGEKIYQSTWYPNDQMILYHNESAHLNMWPMKISFFCVTPATKDGRTPVFDTRIACKRIDPAVLQTFRERGLMYVRNFHEGVDPTWQAFFHTEDKSVVERLCADAGTAFKWTAGGGLRLKQKTQAVWRHPKTDEEIFFNQVQLHHIWCVDPETREALRELYADDDLPRNVYYGDGSRIPDEVMDHLGRVFEEIAVRFYWEKNDFIMLDNMLTTHARDPFEGERTIVVAMGQMIAIEEAIR